ncbi:hypothetical protein [Parvularcula maris]|uniref:Uncharacterized protein n=1 Tax=Parvularcula maris TaxID=2965077 RepID=A0A9X2RHE1_9PROT|nr:hypothetical protein [Parvularcula maris]MCQ8184845.1 hypothetical protein [Parvularcula maris]
MTETTEQDLSYLRALAQKGTKAPLLSGRYLVFWGGLIALTYLGHYAIASGRTPFGGEALGFLWLAFGIVGILGMVVLRRTFPAKPGAASFGNTVARETWSMVGIAISTYVAGALAALVLGAADALLMDTIMAVALVLYGIAFAVTGRAAEIGWFRFVSVLSLILAGVSLTLIGRAELYLYGAAAVTLVGLLPGLILLRGEPAPSPDEA